MHRFRACSLHLTHTHTHTHTHTPPSLTSRAACFEKVFSLVAAEILEECDLLVERDRVGRKCVKLFRQVSVDWRDLNTEMRRRCTIRGVARSCWDFLRLRTVPTEPKPGPLF